VCVCVSAIESVGVRAYEWLRTKVREECERVSVCVCVCERERENERYWKETMIRNSDENYRD